MKSRAVSASNTTPERFREGLDRLAQERRRIGKAPDRPPGAIATTWLHATEDRGGAERTEVAQLVLFRERVAAVI